MIQYDKRVLWDGLTVVEHPNVKGTDFGEQDMHLLVHEAQSWYRLTKMVYSYPEYFLVLPNHSLPLAVTTLSVSSRYLCSYIDHVAARFRSSENFRVNNIDSDLAYLHKEPASKDYDSLTLIWHLNWQYCDFILEIWYNDFVIGSQPNPRLTKKCTFHVISFMYELRYALISLHYFINVF